jgi:hypothetical protein
MKKRTPRLYGWALGQTDMPGCHGPLEREFKRDGGIASR